MPRNWTTAWSMEASTALMCVNYSGFMPARQWGYATLDWNCGTEHWIRPDAKDIYCEATMQKNCLELKQAGKVSKCGIYHNMELALEWLESQRAVMDQEHVDAGWFLRFPNGSVYTTYTQARGPPPHRPVIGPQMREYYIDWRNPEAAAYFVDAIVNTTMAPGVDATFTDDSWGLPAEHPTVPGMLNMTKEEVKRLQFATEAAEQYLVTKLAVQGKFCFDCVGGVVSPLTDNWGRNQRPPPRDSQGCTAWFRHYCKPEMQGRGMFMSWDTFNVTGTRKQSVAAFLVARPPYAYIGGYDVRGDEDWNPLFGLDVGEPTSLCYEPTPGVFRRNWTKGVAELDCNTYAASLPFQA